MDADTQIFRAKVKPEKKVKEKKEPKGKKEKEKTKDCPPITEVIVKKCEDNCGGTPNLCGKCKPKKKRRRGKDATIAEIAESAFCDCCECCHAMLKYLQEVCKLLWCLSGGKVEETRIAKVLCEMLQITNNFGKDCFDLVKCVVQSILPKK